MFFRINIAIVYAKISTKIALLFDVRVALDKILALHFGVENFAHNEH